VEGGSEGKEEDKDGESEKSTLLHFMNQ